MVRELGLLRNSLAGASVLECHVLVELERSDTLASVELAEMLSVDKSGLSRTISVLVKRKWVRERRDPRDGRRKLLSLTPPGRRKVDELNALANSQVDDGLRLLAPSQRIQVMEALQLYSHVQRNVRVREEAHQPRPEAARVRDGLPESRPRQRPLRHQRLRVLVG